jgi:hypothetical protein
MWKALVKVIERKCIQERGPVFQHVAVYTGRQRCPLKEHWFQMPHDLKYQVIVAKHIRHTEDRMDNTAAWNLVRRVLSGET